jgi:hypothetical protein
MLRFRSCLVALFVAAFGLSLASAQTPPDKPAPVDITGKWTASFDTQIGVQTYTYEFAVKDGVVTGKISSSNGEAKLTDGKYDGATVTFTENLDFNGTPLAITYEGTPTSADEIKFTRNVADVSTEDLVAKRAK